jgi:4-amino-4-deoxy-L-arabinose transferase-like glycosyltransferase
MPISFEFAARWGGLWQRRNLKFVNRWSKYCILLPIVLSTVVHLWNPSGFPVLHPDESDYLRKAMHVLAGLGPQEGTNDPIALNNQPYTHPHFGQLFLAAILGGVFGYSNIESLGPSNLVQSVEFLYTIPRVLMGTLAVFDTFVLFKIADRRYDRIIALVASSLFAVMPMSWLLRHIFLDNILLPFLLMSILFALYIKPKSEKPPRPSLNEVKMHRLKRNVIVLLSGILLGIAIYTKIPAFTMIPLVGYLVYTNSCQTQSHRFSNLAIWLIPVILIPLLWPIYALSVGELDLWIDGITGQVSRLEGQANNKLFSAFSNLFKLDPLSLIVGTVGLIFVAIRRDYWLIIWVIPLVIFSYFIGWVIYFHLIPLFPAFCITAAVLLVRIFKASFWRKLISLVLISAIVCFGLVSSLLLITINVNSYQFEAYAAIIGRMIENDNDKIDDDNDTGANTTVLVGHRMYYWIPKYIFHISFDTFSKASLPPKWNSSHIILVVTSKSCCCQCPYFSELYRATKEVSSFTRGLELPKQYPYSGIREGLGKEVSIRMN